MTVFAGTQALFSKDGSKATVLMLAVTENPDAIALNDLLNFPAEDMQGKATKKFSFSEASGVKTLDAVCAFSKLVVSTGSCTLVFHAGGKASFDGGQQTIRYFLTGSEAALMASYFVLPITSGEVFRSSDDRLVMSVELTPVLGNSLEVTAFSFQFN